MILEITIAVVLAVIVICSLPWILGNIIIPIIFLPVLAFGWVIMTVERLFKRKR